MLSAQATDKSVNVATRGCYPGRQHAGGDRRRSARRASTEYIRTIGLYRTKAKQRHRDLPRLLLERHGGEVPREREALEALPGVGRKTANVVLNTAFGEPTIAVDTHIFRVSNRTGLAPGKTVDEVEARLREVHAGRVQAGRAPLADPARPLRLQGAHARVLALPDR